MNRITFTTILLVFSNFSFGQIIQSHIVREQVLDQSFNHALIGSVNNRLLGFSEAKDVMNIDVYDSDSLNLLFREQIQLVENDKYDLEIQGVYRIRDQFKLLATGFSVSTNQFAVFIYSIQENGKLSQKFQRTLFADKPKADLTVLNNVQTSSDNSTLLGHVAFVNDYENYVDHHVCVYDENLTNMFKTYYTSFPKSTVKEKYLLSYCNGTDHLYELKQEVIYNKSIKKYQTEVRLRKYDFKGIQTIHTQTLKFGDGFLLADIRMRETDDTLQLFASLLGSSKKEITGIRGVYAAKFNPDLSIKYSKSQAFSPATKAKSLRGYENAGELDVPLLYGLNNYFTDSKGNNYLLYERTSQTVSSGLTEFYYGSVIAVKINREGTVEWETFIAKSQFFKEKGIPIFIVLPNVAFSLPFAIRLSKDSRQYLSFKPMMKNDELYLIYNDNPVNEGKTMVQARENMININQSVPFVIHLSATGKVEYQIQKNLKIGAENQRIIYSVLEGTTLFTLRDSGKKEVLQRITFE